MGVRPGRIGGDTACSGCAVVTAAVALVLALAACCWPVPTAALRVRRPESGRTPASLRLPRPGARGRYVLLGGLLWFVSGPAAAVSAVVVVWAVVHVRRWNREARRHREADDALAEALGSFVAELGSGSHPALAAERACTDCPPLAAPAMRAVSGALGMGGSVSAALTRCGAETSPLGRPLRRFARAWQLAERHGLPLADVLGSVRDELRARARFAGRVDARMAGPRSSAFVLSVLPVVGVLLGTAMGADPLSVLFGDGLGGVLLVLGSGLTAAGLLWTARITRTVVAT